MFSARVNCTDYRLILWIATARCLSGLLEWTTGESEMGKVRIRRRAGLSRIIGTEALAASLIFTVSHRTSLGIKRALRHRRLLYDRFSSTILPVASPSSDICDDICWTTWRHTSRQSAHTRCFYCLISRLHPGPLEDWERTYPVCFDMRRVLSSCYSPHWPSVTGSYHTCVGLHSIHVS